MRLLIAVINKPELLDDVLSAFLELGITGATIFESEGMGRILGDDISVFAGLQSLAIGMRPRTQTLFSVMPDHLVNNALDRIRDICGSLDAPGTGIAFTLAVDQVVGMAPRIGGGATRESEP